MEDWYDYDWRKEQEEMDRRTGENSRRISAFFDCMTLEN